MTKGKNVNILVNVNSHPCKTLDQLGEFYKSKHLSVDVNMFWKCEVSYIEDKQIDLDLCKDDVCSKTKEYPEGWR